MAKTTRSDGPSGTVVGNPTRPSNSIAAVVVKNPATDQRPDDPQVVVWVGGATRPVNIGDLDVWFPGSVTTDYTSRRDLVAELLAQNRFYIAHRGCGDEAPEHSEAAYRQALRYGAVEMSAQATADGNVICMHDTTVDRTTSLTGNVSAFSLAQLRVPAGIVDYGTTFLGSGWGNSHVPILANELALWQDKGAVLLEPKADPTRVLSVVRSFSEPGKFIMWKFNRNSDGTLPSHAQTARSLGLRLWIYMNSGDSVSLIQQTAALVANGGGAIGMDISDSDANIAAAVATGVPVIVFTVRTRTERDRLSALGVQGYMSTSVSYLRDDTAGFTTDGFAGGVRRYGEYEGASNKLVAVNPSTASVLLAQGTTATLSMGSMSPLSVGTNGYRIAFQARFPTLPADTTQHLDLYFCHNDDSPYAFQSAANTVGGYHVFQRANGGIGVSRHDAGSGSNTTLGTDTADAAVAGTYMSFNVDVTPTQIIFRRLDGTAKTITVSNTQYRGGYWGLSSASSGVAPEFKSLSVVAL